MSAEAQLQGPPGTPYANGVWTIDLTFPENYPFKAPTVTFRTEIKHPNVKTDTGEVCPEVPRGVLGAALSTAILGVPDTREVCPCFELVAHHERAPRPLERARGPQEPRRGDAAWRPSSRSSSRTTGRSSTSS